MAVAVNTTPNDPGAISVPRITMLFFGEPVIPDRKLSHSMFRGHRSRSYDRFFGKISLAYGRRDPG
jgi:hypothetical protein